MSDVINGKPSTNFWIIGGAALVWNLIGVLIYVQNVTMSPEQLATMSPEVQAFFAATPSWAISATAIAVNAGVIGSLLLLLRKAWAVPSYFISLLAIVVQDIEAFAMRDAFTVFGWNTVAISSFVFVIGIALLLYARVTKERGWLN